jgi:spermidine synthase
VSTRLFNQYTKDVTTVDIELSKEMKKLLLYFPNIKFVQEDSIEYLNSIPNQSFDVIYIDTTHDYGRTREELLLSYEKVKENGIISGHDYNTDAVANAITSTFKYPDIEIYLDSS